MSAGYRALGWTDEAVADNAWDSDTVRALQGRWNTSLAFEASDLSVTVRRWLLGDSDPRTLHRRHGWALRRYRGEHRDKALTVAEIRDSIDARAHATRIAHQRSLRRRPSGKPPEMIHLDTVFATMKFYAAPGEMPEDATATLTLMPDEGVQTLVRPLIGEQGPAHVTADDADTGPIWMSPERGHEERTARIESVYAATRQQFDVGVTR